MLRWLIPLALMAGCAVPVRPIAKLVPDANGGAHFEADPEREPQVGPAALTGLTGLLSACGPWGQLAAVVATALVPAAAVHVAHKKNKKNKTNVPA